MTNNQMVHTSFSIEPTIRNAGGSNQYFGWAGGNGNFCYPQHSLSSLGGQERARVKLLEEAGPSVLSMWANLIIYFQTNSTSIKSILSYRV